MKTAAPTSHGKAIKLPSDRRFGLIIGGVLLAFSVFGVYRGASFTTIIGCLVCGTALLTAALIVPRALSPLNRLWYEFGQILGKIVSPLVIGAIFFVIIVPAGLFMRLTGRDALGVRRLNMNSYWVMRDPAGPDGASLNNQF